MKKKEKKAPQRLFEYWLVITTILICMAIISNEFPEIISITVRMLCLIALCAMPLTWIIGRKIEKNNLKKEIKMAKLLIR